MSLGSRFTLVVTCLTLVLPGPCRAQQNDCFTSSSIVGAVLGTFFATAVALALLVFFIWWIYYRRTPNGTTSTSTTTTHFQILFYIIAIGRGPSVASSLLCNIQFRNCRLPAVHALLYSVRQCFSPLVIIIFRFFKYRAQSARDEWWLGSTRFKKKRRSGARHAIFYHFFLNLNRKRIKKSLEIHSFVNVQQVCVCRVYTQDKRVCRMNYILCGSAAAAASLCAFVVLECDDDVFSDCNP